MIEINLGAKMQELEHSLIHYQAKIVNQDSCNLYHAEMKEQNSAENWLVDAQGGGWSTMASISS